MPSPIPVGVAERDFLVDDNYLGWLTTTMLAC